MALTKPRAYQLYDIDFKQSVRVVVTTNVALTGGAPQIVDGVVLRRGNRILVTGQSNPSQNGIYEVALVGVGNSGTWTRSGDAASSGQLLSGTILIVSEGATFSDTQWILETNDPIVIGTTPITFSLFNSDSFGAVNANGTVIAARQPGSIVNLIAEDNININGDPSSNTITISATYAIPSLINNGNTQISIANTDGNISFIVDSVEIAEITSYGLNPITSNSLSLGNATNQWKEVWVSGNTLYLESLPLSVGSNQQLYFNNSEVATVDNSSSYAYGVIDDSSLIVASLDGWSAYLELSLVGSSVVADALIATTSGSDTITGGMTTIINTSAEAISFNGISVTATGFSVVSNLNATDVGTITLNFMDSYQKVYRVTWIIGLNFTASSVLIERIR